MNGTLKKHGAAAGYVVLGANGTVVALCRGWNDPDISVLLGATFGTLFKTRRQAKAAIMSSVADDASRAESEFTIVRVARLEDQS